MYFPWSYNYSDFSFFFNCLGDLYNFYKHADFERYARGTIVIITDGQTFDDFPTSWLERDNSLWDRRMSSFNSKSRRSKRSLPPMKEEPVCEIFGRLSRYLKKVIWILMVDEGDFVTKTKAEFMIKRLMKFHIKRACENSKTINIDFQLMDFNSFN